MGLEVTLFRDSPSDPDDQLLELSSLLPKQGAMSSDRNRIALKKCRN
jgi:hypothetical protein